MFWPREIWGKYVDKLEVPTSHSQALIYTDLLLNLIKMLMQDLKNEENSTKAVQCLNEMVTNALIHVEVCLKSMAGLRDPAIFKSCSIPQVR